MIRPPFGVRLLLGVAATVLEETRKLPQAVLTYPMTAASQTVQKFMRLQQAVTELAIKGDDAWENLFPPTDEQPQWATFDEDFGEDLRASFSEDIDEPEAPGPDETHATAVYEEAAERMTQGRFALYSAATSTPASPAPNAQPQAGKAATRKAPAKKAVTTKAVTTKAPAKKAAPAAPAESVDPNAPDIVVELAYHALTLAQLRARLQSLSLGELEELLAYEETHHARAPYQTLLANRITRAAARG